MTTTRVRLRLLDGAVCCTGGMEPVYGKVAGAMVAGAAAALLGLLTLGPLTPMRSQKCAVARANAMSCVAQALMR